MNLPRPPHIVLLLADQLAASALPTYGNEIARAPRLAQLGAEGVVFERALCASPLCVPSRASLMTGLLPSRTGAIDNAGELPAAVPTFAHRLRVLGYRTVLVGKMHFIGPDQLHGFEERPLTDVYPAGFDWIPDWDLADDERLSWYHDLSSVLRAGPVRSTLQLEYDAEVVEQACRAIAAADERPLLLVVSFTHPHDPYEVPAEHWNRYDGATIDPPAHPQPGTDPPTHRLRAMLAAETVAVSPEQALLARRGYYGAISLVDDHVATTLDALAEHGLAEDAVVIVTSDHGDMLGERGLWYKMAPFEGSIRVPLIVHGPRRFAPRRIAGPVSLLDLASTLVELAGGGSPDELDGISLARALAGASLPARDVPLEYLAEGVRAPQVTLVRGPLKLVRSLGEPDLVYDVEADPAERVDLSSEPGTGPLREAGAVRWDLAALDAEVRASQRRRRLVAGALAVGRVTKWDHPEGSERYIDTGDDFWETLERARRL
ncbi:MAG TPA: choline-sulfatase [Gaiellaceae bacterium]|nr:choline-sulfatase [Gaiellaceae bacterium]